jgi:phospholipid/cholesterol/gamma-HCH transport system substrate-binding protein
MQGAWKVGLLVVVFGALLLGAYSFLGRTIFAPKTTPLYAIVPDASGVHEGAQVLMAGVNVGTVSKVNLESPNEARIALAINEKQSVPVGSTVQIPSSLIGFGDNPVVIVPPKSPSGASLTAGAEMTGSKLSPLEGILPDLTGTVQELNKTLVATREFITDKELKTKISELVNTGTKTIDKFGHLADNFQGILADNRQAFTSSMKSVQVAMLDVQKSAEIARKLLSDPKWKDQAQALLTTMDATVKKAKDVMDSVDAMVNDPNIRQPIHDSLANVKTITDTGTRIADNTEKITAEGITISKNLNELTVKANELAEEAKGVLKKISDFFNKVPKTSGLKGLEAGMDLIHETAPNHWRTDMIAKLPMKDGSLHLGIHDAFEANKFTIQLGKNIGGGSEYRYGIYASKPGVGVDFRLARGLMLQGDLYDINDIRLDLGARYEFKNGLLGWLGFNRVFDGNAFYAGLGFRK